MQNCGQEKNARGVRVFGRDCRVALRAPRNDPYAFRYKSNDRRLRFFTANRMTRT
ncbi:MAG: hypothetical protein LBL66_03545 [Clostridiales bacterium]|nr:hypothetical protein [Clostridiales bacterium]